MGRTETTVNGLIAAQGKDGLSLIDDQRKDAGKIIVHNARLVDQQLSSSSSSFDQIKNHTDRTNKNMVDGTNPIAMTSSSSFDQSKNHTGRANKNLVNGTSPITMNDYINGGCEINLMVAIDFTSSNGDPRKQDTLHYRGGGDMNDYEKAILAFGKILTKFDTDKKIPVW